MKPKNRVYCPECHRQKMLFETKSHAEYFLKFNSDEIFDEKGYKPIRTYYCSGCGGWHITSHEKISYDFQPVIKILNEWNNTESLLKLPEEDDDPQNPCVIKSRQATYTSILELSKIEDKNPDSISDVLLSGIASVNGYKKLAESENELYMKDADVCSKYLLGILIDMIHINLDKMNSMNPEERHNEYTERKLIKQTLKFTAVLHNFDSYRELSLNMKSLVKKFSSSIYNEFQTEMSKSRPERTIYKLEKNIRLINEFIKNGEYCTADKFVHFSITSIQKVTKSNPEMNEVLIGYVNKLINLKNVIVSHIESEMNDTTEENIKTE